VKHEDEKLLKGTERKRLRHKKVVKTWSHVTVESAFFQHSYLKNNGLKIFEK